MKFMYLYIGVVFIFAIGYQIFMFTRANKRKKENYRPTSVFMKVIGLCFSFLVILLF